MNKLTLAQAEEYQRKKRKLKTGAEFKELAREIRDRHGLTDREALSLFNGETDLLEIARQEIERLREIAEHEQRDAQYWKVSAENQQHSNFKLIEEVERLNDEKAVDSRLRLEQRKIIDTFIEALQFYADGKKYYSGLYGIVTPEICSDSGRVAREALKRIQFNDAEKEVSRLKLQLQIALDELNKIVDYGDGCAVEMALAAIQRIQEGNGHGNR